VSRRRRRRRRTRRRRRRKDVHEDAGKNSFPHGLLLQHVPG